MFGTKFRLNWALRNLRVEGYEVPPVGEQELNLLPINDIKKAVDSRLKEAYARNARVYN